MSHPKHIRSLLALAAGTAVLAMTGLAWAGGGGAPPGAGGGGGGSEPALYALILFCIIPAVYVTHRAMQPVPVPVRRR